MMLNYNDILPGKYIETDNGPYKVLKASILQKQQRKPVNQVKMKNLITGNVCERTFQHSEKIEKADLKNKQAVFIYSHRGEYWFHSTDDPSDRFSVPETVVGKNRTILVNGMRVILLSYHGTIIGVNVPEKVELIVAEAPPNIKGNTAQGGTKQVTLESGAVVDAPMFIESGDVVRINTKTGQYDARVKKINGGF